MALQQIDRATFGSAWQAWHQERERRLADPHGFLAVTGLYWLTSHPERFPDAPGAWSSDADGVLVELEPGEELVVAGVAVHGSHRFGVLPERGDVTATFADAVVEVARRGGRYLLRPRHPDHPLLVNFRDVPTYLPNPRWALVGQFFPSDPPEPTTVGSVIDGLEHVYESPGVVEFELRGETFRLRAFNGATPGSLMVLFTDATSGLTTYPASRVLHLDRPDEDGSVLIDFNRAVNMPCAFTDFATCPLPPPGNHLPVGIEVGEKTPYERS